MTTPAQRSREAASAGPLRLQRPADLCALLDMPFDDEQLAAITAPLRPGLIVAGAGSGKTTVMAARVVWLVGRGEVAPERVLGLTFTNKAAGELADRVRRRIRDAGLGLSPRTADDDVTTGADPRHGADLAPGADLVPDADGIVSGDLEPTVATYHAFAGSIVRDHGLRIGVEPDSRLIAAATRYMLAMRVMREAHGRFEALDVAPTLIAERILRLSGELAEHLVTSSDLRRCDHDLIAAVARVAKPTQHVTKVVDTARARTELSLLVDAYTQAKRARDLLDFDDQIALAARIAAERPEVVAAYRRDYDVVLLDEYQDTSVGQRLLLASLFGDGHAVTAVGDPFQAIYGWRGASVANIEGFPQHFPARDGRPADRYSLPVNHRSGARLLDLANALAAPLRAMHPGVEPLRAPLGADPGAGRVRCGVLATATEEHAFVVAEVQRAHGQPSDDPGEAATTWSDIAILVRQNSVIAPLYERLTTAGVPVEVVGLRGLLGLPGVADVIATLAVLHDPTANPSLVRLLTGPRWSIGPRDLRLLGRRAAQLAHVDAFVDAEEADLQEAKRALDRALDDAVSGADPAEVVSLLDALESPGPGGYSPEARDRFARLAAELEDLRAAMGEALVDLVHRVISTTGLDVEAAASPDAVGAARRDALAAFVDVAAGFHDLDGEATLGSFLAYLEAADEEESGLDLPTPTFGDSVTLLTMHRAKGLEWRVVVVPEFTTGVFPSSNGRDRHTRNAWVIPPSLRGDAHRMPEVGDWSTKGLDAYNDACRSEDLSEELRLAYVAVTRAQQLLIASTSWWGPTQIKLRGPSPFFEVVREHCDAGGGEVVHDAPRPTEERNPGVAAVTGIEVGWPAVLDPTRWAARQRAAAEVLAELARVRVDAPDVSDVSDVSGAADQSAGPGALDVTDGVRVDDRLDVEPLTTDHPAADRVRSWDQDLGALLTELAAASSPRAHDVVLPRTLSASQLMQLASNPDALAGDLARPMPRPPRPAARRGTRFHAWLQARYAQQPLLPPEDLPGASDAEIRDDEDLALLQEAFEAGPYADRTPYQLEAPFSLVLAGRVVRGRIDAIYETDHDGVAGLEVVDWKTSRRHDADPLQLAIYRLACAELHGVPLERVTAAFYYVRDASVERAVGLPGRAELERLLGEGGEASD